MIGVKRVGLTWIRVTKSRTEKMTHTVLSIRAEGKYDEDLNYLIRTIWSSSLTM